MKESRGSFYLCDSWVSAWVVTSFAQSFDLCDLEGEGKVGEGTVPGAWVIPLYHRGVDFSDRHLVRSHCHTLKSKGENNFNTETGGGREKSCSHSCLTYL